MTPVRRVLLVLAVPVWVLTTAGCAKGSAGPTQQEYAVAADGVCTAGNDKLRELYMLHAVEELDAAFTGETTVYVERPERWVRSKIVPAYRNMSGGLKGIPPPDGDVAYLTDLYADLDVRIETLHRRPSDGRAAIEGDDLLRERFESYGMTTCPPVFDEDPDWEDPEKVAEFVAEREAARGGQGE